MLPPFPSIFYLRPFLPLQLSRIPLGKLTEDGKTLVHPACCRVGEFGLRVALHFVQSFFLVCNVGSITGGHLFDELDLLLAATFVGRDDRAERGAACFQDVVLHVMAALWTELVAHRHVGFLLVVRAVNACPLVVVPDRWPAASAR